MDEGISRIEDSESEDEIHIGPSIPFEFTTGPDFPLVEPSSKKKRETYILDDPFLAGHTLPSGGLYEISYMHRDAVTHVFASEQNEFIISISSGDGVVKFWKKLVQGVEFVKSFACESEILDATMSASGSELAVISSDFILRLFDIKSFNLFGIAKTEKAFAQGGIIPNRLCFASPSSALGAVLAVSDLNSGTVFLVNTNSFLESPRDYAAKKVNLHEFPVVCMEYNEYVDAIVSIDAGGFVEIWSPDSGKKPVMCRFESKFDTDLFELNRSQSTAISLGMSRAHFAIFTSDYFLKIFRIEDCKLVRSIDESLDTLTVAQSDPLQRRVHVDAADLSNRISIEKKLQLSEFEKTKCVLFDDSGDYLIYSTIIGIKIVYWKSNRLVRILGKVESTERFLNIALYQGQGGVRLREMTGGDSENLGQEEVDPTLIATAFEKNRIFLFTNRLPSGEVRDVNNEPVILNNNKMPKIKKNLSSPHRAMIHTTMGDIEIELFGKECRKTVENFATHARNGYFDAVIFHRVIRGFMIQTGDPEGTGSGGESIWGSEFADEFHPNLNHKFPFMVSMANCGPNTNGSQFFITTVPCPWLDGKHTVFGRVLKGMEVVKAIEEVETDDHDRPKTRDIKILTVNILT